MGDPNSSEESFRKQAWDYFQMHAGQRLSTFNYYIVISSVLATALFTSIQKGYAPPGLSVILGFLLALFSFVFWKLDLRNKELIKNAEAALKYFENKLGPKDPEGEVHVTKLFTYEEVESEKKRTARYFSLWRKNWSYSDCFSLVFVSFQCVGILGMVVGLIKAG